MRDETSPTVLVVDDEPDLRTVIGSLLDDTYKVRTAACAGAALDVLRTDRPRCILLDLSLPDMDGLRFLESLRERDLQVPVIVVTARNSVQTAVDAMRLGAADFITKPFEPDVLRMAVGRAVERAWLLDRVEAFAEGRGDRVAFDSIITRSPAMRRVIDVARQMAQNDSRVLITGETGTGKELIARAIHDGGTRRNHPFVAVNCPAIPSELAESEFFGHEKGSFTGALKAKRGRFELADEGTIFLDEVTCLGLDMQAKLLRVLQNGSVDRVGAEASVKVNVRVLAATNLDVRAEVTAGRFREDLYYRLNVVPIHLPPLRERGEDVELLLDHFLAVFARRARKEVRGYSEEARRLLNAYAWPGNVRELEHTVERLVVLERSPEIGVDHLPVDIVLSGERARSSPHPSGAPLPLKEARSRFEREYVLGALVRAQWNQTRAAEALGVNRNTLIAKMKEYELKSPRALRRE